MRLGIPNAFPKREFDAFPNNHIRVWELRLAYLIRQTHFAYANEIVANSHLRNADHSRVAGGRPARPRSAFPKSSKACINRLALLENLALRTTRRAGCGS
nr:hypothetical protein Iba_chr02bCG9000 [Ipomoea batatas]